MTSDAAPSIRRINPKCQNCATRISCSRSRPSRPC